jgi:hypothetical protein
MMTNKKEELKTFIQTRYKIANMKSDSPAQAGKPYINWYLQQDSSRRGNCCGFHR